MWKALGYRYSPNATTTDFDYDSKSVDSHVWDNSQVFRKWRERYPRPPDFLGMKRIYEKEVDEESLRSVQALIRTIPVAHKQSLKQTLRPYGFKGFQLSELVPNLTRRCQVVNWLIWYRGEVWGRDKDGNKPPTPTPSLKALSTAEVDSPDEVDSTDSEVWTPPKIDLE